MARRDKIHYPVRKALEKEGWTITADPYRLKLPDLKPEVDLEAEKWLEVEKNNQKILVEIKSFTSVSLIYDYYEATGQYDFYRESIVDLNMPHEIWLAISTVTYYRMKRKPTLLTRLHEKNVHLIIVDLNKEEIAKWIN